MSATEVSTSFENITYEVKGSIAYITMNRPKVMNALNRKTVEELNAAFHAAKDDATVKGIILTGAGEKAFIAGADIAELSAIDGDKAGEFSAEGPGGALVHRDAWQASDRSRKWLRPGRRL